MTPTTDRNPSGVPGGWRWSWVLAVLWALLISEHVIGEGRPMNVLFIAVDDLRPALGCFGDPIAKTPHIDRLARRGTTFLRAYCQQAVCSPSRLSLLTGRRPDSIQVWDLNTHFREAIPEAVTLPQWFKRQGYWTRSIGKIFHGSGDPSRDPPSWSEAPLFDYVRDPTLRYATPENLAGEGWRAATGPIGALIGPVAALHSFALSSECGLPSNMPRPRRRIGARTSVRFRVVRRGELGKAARPTAFPPHRCK